MDIFIRYGLPAVGQLVLILICAYYTYLRTLVLGMSDAQLEKLVEEGSAKAQILQKLLASDEVFKISTRIAVLFTFIFSGCLIESAFLPAFVGEKTLSKSEHLLLTLAFVIAVAFLMALFGILIPRKNARRDSDKKALRNASRARFAAALFFPLGWLVNACANGLLRLFGVDPHEAENDVSEEDIHDVVDSAVESGSIDDEEREFIQNVFEFDDLTAGEICTHRTDVTLLWAEESDAEWEETILSSGYSFYPICEESVDNVIGVLSIKEYYRLSDRSRASVMKKAVHAPYFVPESVKADVLFRNMKSKHLKISIVLDEYGGLRGIVTINDLIDELVGDYGGDETLTEKKDAIMEKISENSYRLIGNVSLEEIENELGLRLPVDDYDTFSGMVFSEVGSIPEDGTTFELDCAGMHINVVDVHDHQIECAVITLLQNDPEEKEDRKNES